MIRTLPSFKLLGFNPPVRRVLAVDPGHRCFKLLLAESDFGRLRILKQEQIDLKSEGLVSPEEIRSHLAASMSGWGNPAVALVVPEHVSSSHRIELPDTAGPSELEKLIADETVKLSGVTESRVVYDFIRTEDAGQNKQQYWVTLCQEADIRERILQLGLDREDVCEVTTTANALIAAFRSAAPFCSRAILVHLGAQSTTVAVLVAGQPAYSASFQMGGDFFTRAIARQQNCPEEAAEGIKRQSNLLAGSARSEAFVEVADGWAAELKRQLNEWFQENPAFAAEVRSFSLISSGAGFDQPGFKEYLKSEAGLNFDPWPKSEGHQPVNSDPGFEIACGAALQSLGHSAHVLSLLPEDYRVAWQQRLSRQRIEMASFVLILVCALLLGIGTVHKLSLYNSKRALLDKVLAAQTAVDANDALTGDLVSEYENLRPIAASRQNTIDTLKSLGLIQQSCVKTSFWYVLLADQQSYFSLAPAALSTNRPAKTNLLGPSLEALRPVPLVPRAQMSTTNLVPSRPGLIAELCVPGDAEPSRQVLSELVRGWKQQPMFSKVDLLSEDLRRNLADPKVIVPERHYVLSLDFAETDFQQALRWRKASSGRAGSGAPGTRRSPRPSSPSPASPEGFNDSEPAG